MFPTSAHSWNVNVLPNCNWVLIILFIQYWNELRTALERFPRPFLRGQNWTEQNCCNTYQEENIIMIEENQFPEFSSQRQKRLFLQISKHANSRFLFFFYPIFPRILFVPCSCNFLFWVIPKYKTGWHCSMLRSKHLFCVAWDFGARKKFFFFK